MDDTGERADDAGKRRETAEAVLYSRSGVLRIRVIIPCPF
jgi:hypothetical protein